jgi:hypothetical protein
MPDVEELRQVEAGPLEQAGLYFPQQDITSPRTIRAASDPPRQPSCIGLR